MSQEIIETDTEKLQRSINLLGLARSEIYEAAILLHPKDEALDLIDIKSKISLLIYHLTHSLKQKLEVTKL